MHTLEQIEEEVKLLPAEEQKTLLSHLVQLLTKSNKLTSDSRQKRVGHFFESWDANHSVTVGETPSRQRTYADKHRLRWY